MASRRPITSGRSLTASSRDFFLALPFPATCLLCPEIGTAQEQFLFSEGAPLRRRRGAPFLPLVVHETARDRHHGTPGRGQESVLADRAADLGPAFRIDQDGLRHHEEIVAEDTLLRDQDRVVV